LLNKTTLLLAGYKPAWVESSTSPPEFEIITRGGKYMVVYLDAKNQPSSGSTWLNQADRLLPFNWNPGHSRDKRSLPSTYKDNGSALVLLLKGGRVQAAMMTSDKDNKRLEYFSLTTDIKANIPLFTQIYDGLLHLIFAAPKLTFMHRLQLGDDLKKAATGSGRGQPNFPANQAGKAQPTLPRAKPHIHAINKRH
jgi:hypothetical protein